MGDDAAPSGRRSLRPRPHRRGGEGIEVRIAVGAVCYSGHRQLHVHGRCLTLLAASFGLLFSVRHGSRMYVDVLLVLLLLALVSSSPSCCSSSYSPSPPVLE